MSKVTSKLQVTVPKTVATRHGIRPGDEIDWIDSPDAIRVVPRKGSGYAQLDTAGRLALFDQATARQRKRDRGSPLPSDPRSRGWKRDDLYTRARPR